MYLPVYTGSHSVYIRRGGGYSRFFFRGMCCWEKENWSIHLPNLAQKLDRYTTGNPKKIPIFWNFGKFWLHFQHFGGFLLEYFALKKIRPIYLPTFRFEKGSFICKRGGKWDPISRHIPNTSCHLGTPPPGVHKIIILLQICRIAWCLWWRLLNWYLHPIQPVQ